MSQKLVSESHFQCFMGSLVRNKLTSDASDEFLRRFCPGFSLFKIALKHQNTLVLQDKLQLFDGKPPSRQACASSSENQETMETHPFPLFWSRILHPMSTCLLRTEVPRPDDHPNAALARTLGQMLCQMLVGLGSPSQSTRHPPGQEMMHLGCLNLKPP